MYVFGGRSDQLGQFHSSRDMYCDRLKVLDLETAQWQEPNVTGDRPSGRRSHSACKSCSFYACICDDCTGAAFVYDPLLS